jgi:hypothetical protein
MMPFSIFMRRSFKKNRSKLLGWEYCGEYLAVDESQDIEMYDNLKKADKDWHIQDMYKSLQSPKGGWRKGLAWRRKKIKRILKEGPAGEAAELRKLGSDNERLSDIEFGKLVVHWQGFMRQAGIVKFVRYDEDMYNFVKVGETTRDKDGILVSKSGAPRAKASDWYDEFDRPMPLETS